MSDLNYIIFHPDSARINALATASAIFRNGLEPLWEGDIWIDSFGGNEDPWVHTYPWLYSYCHATQLKRSRMTGGNILFFVSGDAADKGYFECDTVFVVDKRHTWPRISGTDKNKTSIPPELMPSDAIVQDYHLGDVARGAHPGRYTFSAKMHSPELAKNECFSFLPLCRHGDTEKRYKVCLSEIEDWEKTKLTSKGKYPQRLSAVAAENLWRKIYDEASILVVGDVQCKGIERPAVGCYPCGSTPKMTCDGC